MEPCLRLKQVAKFYGTRLILKNISLTIHKGEIVLVAGENGAGKSTLLRLMAGMTKPASGTVTCSVPAHKIAYVGHKTFIYPGLSALENLRFWARLGNLDSSEKALLHVLNKVGLKHRAFDHAGSFSRGMTQRLSLARAFMTEPLLLFLDEPATGLDVQSVHILHREITLSKKRGTCVIWVSHDIETDMTKADTVVELQNKTIIWHGPVKEYKEVHSGEGCVC